MSSSGPMRSATTDSLHSTVTVTVCSTGTGSHGTAVASTGVKVPPTPTGSPIAQFTGAASVNGVSGSALGMIIAGGVALVSSCPTVAIVQ